MYLFAHLSLLLVPPYPNQLVSNVIRADFPLLTRHHDSLTSALFPAGWSSVPIIAPSSTRTPLQGQQSPATWSETFRSYLPTSLGGVPAKESIEGGADSASRAKAKPKKTEAEKRFDRGRWAFWVGAGAAMVGYLLAAGIVRIELGEEGEWEEEEKEGEDEVEVEMDEGEDDDDDEEEE
jgi:sorting and assembly machinery component 37